MGDNGELYVQPDVIPLYRELMKHAEAVTPNQFEAEYVHSFLQLHGIHFDTIALSP
jgi:pyridoxal/pyridoxine/pyridoxamine kinase